MGDMQEGIADLILDGTLCQVCGALMEDLIDELSESPGYPRTCEDCLDEG